MEIPINEKYKITSDANNYIVNQRQTSKDGKPTSWRQIEFHANFEMIVSDMLEREIRASNAKTFKEVVNILKLLEKPVQELVGSSKEALRG